MRNIEKAAFDGPDMAFVNGVASNEPRLLTEAGQEASARRRRMGRA